MLAKAFPDTSLGHYYRFQIETGLLGNHCVPGKWANYNGNLAQQLPLVSAYIVFSLKKVRNMKIYRIKSVFVIRRYAAIRQKYFHVQC